MVICVLPQRLQVFGTLGDSPVPASILEARRPGIHDLHIPFYVGSGDLNLGLYLCTASPLPTEPSPQPSCLEVTWKALQACQ